MTSLGVKIGGTLSVLVVLLAIFYKKNDDDELRERLDSVLSGLLRAENKIKLPSAPKVAVGFGACQDLISKAIDVMHILDGHAPQEPEHFNVIANRDELTKVFGYFFQHGAAAERYVNNATFFQEVLAASFAADHWQVPGGSALAMARRFAKEGCDTLLGATMTEELHTEMMQSLENFKVVGERLQQDEWHILLEYPKGIKWDHMQTNRANRFIVHNDQFNPHLKSLDEFTQAALSFEPSLLVVGGLQMMDHYPFKEGERASLLGELASFLHTVPDDTRMHFEMASYAEEDTLLDVIQYVAYYVDSLGMNEQELPNLYSVLTNGSVTLISDPLPRIATTLDHMRAVYRIMRDQATRDPARRPLTRLHVHTLAYQAILVTKGSAWKNTMSAAAKASLTANRHVCGSNTIDSKKAKILMDESFSMSRDSDAQRMHFEAERPVSCWEEADYEICVAPVLVCTDVMQTGGGGDNISSAGLVLQI